MDVIYGLIPGMIVLGIVAVGILFWAAKSGQYDDMDGEAHRILMDDDLEPEVKSGTDVQPEAEVKSVSEEKTESAEEGADSVQRQGK